MRNILISSLIFFPAVSSAFTLKKDASGSSVAWKGNVEFVFDSRARDLLREPQAFAAAKAALETIGAMVPGYAVSIREGATHGAGYDSSPGAHNQNQVIVETNWTYDPDTTATTLITVDEHSHKILHVDVLLNGQMRKFKVLPPTSTPGGEFEDIQNILTHEFGHAFGLDHNPSDSKVVMYPRASTGEVIKRTLADDDKEGLHALYSTQASSSTSGSPTQNTPHVGCTTSSGQFLVWMALMALPLLLKRRRPAGVLAALSLMIGGTASASQSSDSPAPVKTASMVATAKVVSLRTLRPTSKVLSTEITLEIRSCIKGTCPEQVTVVVGGGRYDGLEQLVDSKPLPESGSVVGITIDEGTSLNAPGPSFTRLYDLSVSDGFAAFARGLTP